MDAWSSPSSSNVNSSWWSCGRGTSKGGLRAWDDCCTDTEVPQQDGHAAMPAPRSRNGGHARAPISAWRSPAECQYSSGWMQQGHKARAASSLHRAGWPSMRCRHSACLAAPLLRTRGHVSEYCTRCLEPSAGSPRKPVRASRGPAPTCARICLPAK
jgi:hypothetical protein